jgi:hypothetical protein
LSLLAICVAECVGQSSISTEVSLSDQGDPLHIMFPFVGFALKSKRRYLARKWQARSFSLRLARFPPHGNLRVLCQRGRIDHSAFRANGPAQRFNRHFCRADRASGTTT